MRELKTDLNEVRFRERPTFAEENKQCPPYSIIVSDPEDNKEYCQNLMDYLLQIRTDKYLDEFVDYQCSKLENIEDWLLSLESLIDQNTNYFLKHQKEYILPLLYNVIILKRSKYKNNEIPVIKTPNDISTHQKEEVLPIDQGEEAIELFDIEKVKNYLSLIPGVIEQIRMLHRFKTNYLQHRNKVKQSLITPLDEQIDLEINYLNLVAQYRPSKNYDFTKRRYMDRLVIKGDPKPLILSFHALLNHSGDGRGRYLTISNTQFVQFLYQVLQDSFGSPINKKLLANLILPKNKKQDQLLIDFDRSDSFKMEDRDQYYFYDIEYIKRLLLQVPKFEERILLINRIYTNYLQHRKLGDTNNLFAMQINLELQQQRLDFDFERKSQTILPSRENRIRINGRVNVLMTFFYELLEEFPEKYSVQGLENTKGEIIIFVQKYFESKKGNTFSEHTLRSILTPSKWEKRCTSDKQVKIKSFWKIS